MRLPIILLLLFPGVLFAELGEPVERFSRHGTAQLLETSPNGELYFFNRADGGEVSVLARFEKDRCVAFLAFKNRGAKFEVYRQEFLLRTNSESSVWIEDKDAAVEDGQCWLRKDGKAAAFFRNGILQITDMEHRDFLEKNLDFVKKSIDKKQ